MSSTTSGLSKISITIYVHGSAEEVTNVKENLEMIKTQLSRAFTYRMLDEANNMLKVAGQLLAVADLNVIRVEPNKQTKAE